MGWYFDWIVESTLSFFGFGYKDAKILFLGLDNAGKTTLLMKLKDDKLGTHAPTFHPNSEELIIGNVRFHTHDLGGHQAARKLWRDYFTTVDGVVYIVDAMDAERFPEARRELELLLQDDSLSTVPFLILGNKIDHPHAVSEQQLCLELGLYGLTGKGKNQREGQRIIEVFMCSVVRDMGYKDGLEWFSEYFS